MRLTVVLYDLWVSRLLISFKAVKWGLQFVFAEIVLLTNESLLFFRVLFPSLFSRKQQSITMHLKYEMLAILVRDTYLSRYILASIHVNQSIHSRSSIHTNQILLSSTRLKLSHDLSHMLLKRLKLLWGEIAFQKRFELLQITVERQDWPVFTVFLTRKT